MHPDRLIPSLSSRPPPPTISTTTGYTATGHHCVVARPPFSLTYLFHLLLPPTLFTAPPLPSLCRRRPPVSAPPFASDQFHQRHLSLPLIFPSFQLLPLLRVATVEHLLTISSQPPSFSGHCRARIADHQHGQPVLQVPSLSSPPFLSPTIPRQAPDIALTASADATAVASCAAGQFPLAEPPTSGHLHLTRPSSSFLLTPNSCAFPCTWLGLLV